MTLDLDPKTTALVLIDLQQGIVGMPVAPHSGPAVIDKSVLLARALTERGGTLVRVHVAFSDDFGDLPGQAVDTPMQAPPGGFPAAWTAFAPQIAELPAQVTLVKRQWGAFHGTELDLQLRRRGIKTIVLAGIATNFGVESTAREAWQHSYAVVVAEDACSSVSAEAHDFSIKTILPRIARVRSTQAVLEALG